MAEEIESLLVMAAVLMVGCGASTPVPQYAGITESQYVERRDLPPSPDAVAIPDDKNWVEPLAATKCTDKDGILLSPEKAVRAKLWKTSYEGLRTLYDLDRKVWTEHRIVYDERITQANKEIERRSPSWWSENKGTVAWAGGFLMGAAATVAIVYAVDEVKQP